MPDASNHILIQRLIPKNVLSFGPRNPGIELEALTVLIGPNGCGKSNLIEVISLMRSASKEFADVTRKGGGVSEWIWKGEPREPASIEWIVRNREGGVPLRHFIEFSPYEQRFSLDDETVEEAESRKGQKAISYYSGLAKGEPTIVYRHGPEEELRRTEAPLRSHDNSVVAQLRDPVGFPELSWLAQNYDEIRIYREWTFGRNAVFRNPQKADMRNDALEENFSNLGLFLSRIRTKFPAAKRALLEGLKDLYEDLSDFDVHIEGGTVQVFFTEGDFSIPATRLSDGTLRYLCLLAILCDPEPPPLVCIEEPELGLHPDILPKVADLLKQASKRTQIIVTTHSDILVDAMTERPEYVVVCEKSEGKTEMNRLSAGDLAIWLEKYRLGQLWIQGQIGGTRW